MEPNVQRTGTTGAGQQAAEGQSLSPQTNANQATQRANTNPNINRGSTQEGAQFSGPGNPGNPGNQGSQGAQPQQQQQTGYGRSNSS
jgi:hypothetical protein